MHPSSATKAPLSPSSSPDTGLPDSWRELLELCQDETGDRPLLDRVLDLWRQTHGAASAGLYLSRDGHLDQEAAVGSGLPEGLPAELPEEGSTQSLRSLRFPDGWLLYAPAAGAGAPRELAADPLTVLLGFLLRSCRLKRDLKEQQFQGNYRVLELEALYDVGLAIAATLDLDRLSEEVLMRAVSLLDARRGALYILEDGRYTLDRTFGGTAARSLDADNPELFAFLAGRGDAPADLLPGATYLLGLPIAVEDRPKGLLVTGDKESRRGVGPFLPADRRTLALFANQAAIALENARLHREALERERLEREMHLAAEIQRQILPKGAPGVEGFQLAGWNRPARQVGGDYYDLFLLGSSRVSVVVGDVSGKGIPAALLVSTLHSALRLLLDRDELGPSLLDRLNRHIVESSMPNKFITLILGELAPESGVFRYLNAGHNPGLLLRAVGEVEELPSGGVPLGLLPLARFLMREVTLEPGDLLCLYSDGITEAEDLDEEQFGTERLVEILREHRHRPLQEVLDAIQHAVTRFSAGRPQLDDQTLVLVRRDGT